MVLVGLTWVAVGTTVLGAKVGATCVAPFSWVDVIDAKIVITGEAMEGVVDITVVGSVDCSVAARTVTVPINA